MTPPAPAAARILITEFQPATFPERGATVPFTSPMLQQGRVRLGAGGVRELVIRNPAGGPGWYVGPWEGVIEIARVTVHDRLVYRRIEETGALTPLELRQAARSVAAEGYGGPSAKEAALAAIAEEEREWRASYATLLATLLGQAGLAGSEAIAGAHSRQDLIALAPTLLAPIAPRLGLKPEVLARTLEELAAVLARIGGTPDRPTHTARDLAAAERLLAEVKALAADDPRADPDAVRAILANGELTVALAGDALARARAEATRPQVLLTSWAEDQATVKARLTRAEWLLDGWAYLVSLWDTAGEQAPGRQRHALPELHGLLPPLPREVTGLVRVPPPAPALGRKVGRGQEWQAALADADLVARNERALARSVA